MASHLGESILITGGTGSFGKAFIRTCLERHPEIKRLVVFSRDELKQYEMSMDPAFSRYQSRLRFFLGDVRDGERLKRACKGVDTIVHAAALKQVPAAEYNPMEFIKTNVLGAQNVIDAALETEVSKVVALSTDKAAAPINLYGATKLCSDKLFIAANNIKGWKKLAFSVVRYGNVLGSRGSVVPYFLSQKKNGKLPITHPEMTRFNITLDEGIQLVVHALEKSLGGELYVPKIPSYRLPDLARALAPQCEQTVVGIRPGEKLHEEMITESDSLTTIDCGPHYIVLPQDPHFNREHYMQHHKGKPVAKGFRYNSGENTQWLTADEIRSQVKAHVDPNFEV